MSARKAVLLAVVSIVLISTAYAGDPPARVARLNYINGEVSVQPNGVDDWVAANINRPLTSSDRVWADKDSRAELQLGAAAIRLNEETSLTLVNVSDNNVQVQLDQGTLNLHVVELFDGEIYEVDTPNVQFTVRKPGTYRFDVDNAGDTTVVTAFKGEGDVTGDGPAVRVRKNEQYTFRNGRSLVYAYTDAPGRDGFDDWCRVRADRQDRALAARYVSRYAVGYEDLDDYGYWETVSAYGPVWYPRHVVVGWAPYRYGHWVWVSPWGWTWVDDAPWGFAPFHYGRWVYYHNRWGWCPGPRHVRPFYAPALVAWVGGSHWGVGLSFGVGGGVGWFPLGWGEPYIPYYRHSRGYFQHVNVTNTRITNITYITNNYYDRHRDITNIHYVNRGRPDAVTAVSNDVFRTSRPTRNAFVRVSAADMKRASLERDVRVNPTTNSVLGVNAGERRASPPERIMNRPGRGAPVERTTSVTNAQPGRQGRPEVGGARGRGPVETPAVAAGNGRTTRGVPRPPDRTGEVVKTAEVEHPSDVPRPGRNVNSGTGNAEARVSTPTRVPRPSDRQVPDSLKTDSVYTNRGSRTVDRVPTSPGAERTEAVGSDMRPTRTVPRPPQGQVIRSEQPNRVDNVEHGNSANVNRADRTNGVSRVDRIDGSASNSDRVERSVPRPSEGQVMRQDRQVNSAEREVRQPGPPLREDRVVTRSPEVSRPTVTRSESPRQAPPARAESPKQSSPARESKPESRPSRDNKVEHQKNGGPQAGLRSYPSPYNSFSSRPRVTSASYTAGTRNPGATVSDYRPTSTGREMNVDRNNAARSYSSYSGGSRPSYSARSSSNHAAVSRYSAPSRSVHTSPSITRGSSRSVSRGSSGGGRHNR